MDLELLSRFQFGITAVMHIIFPSISIGLSCWLTYWYAQYLITKDEKYLTLYNFWKKIFAVGFGIGVVTGTMITFEFGLNWSRYAHAVGPILGVIISMEVITAFFLEAGFIGIMLYGGDKINRKVRMFATSMVSFGTILSMTWIMSANSWMQTPGGFELVNGQFLPKDWVAVIFNESFIFRLIHIMIGATLSSTLFITGVAAYYLIKKRNINIFRTQFNSGMIVIAFIIPFQFWVGDQTVFKVGLDGGQTGKLLGFEGHFETNSTDWLVAIWADQKEQRNVWQVGIPKLGGLLVNRDINKPVPGIKTVPIEDQPDVNIIFYTFRVMFFICITIFIMILKSWYHRFKGNFYESKSLHKFAYYMMPMGFVAIIAGWLTAEIGRQPYVVYGHLRTDHSFSFLSPNLVAFMLLIILIVYVTTLTLYIRFLIKEIELGLPKNIA